VAQKRIAFDVDGTLCPEGPASERMFAEPVERVRKLMNRAYDSGAFVMVFTARQWSDYKTTEYWLRQHGFRFSVLICGKPNYDRLLDDRATNDPAALEAWFNDA
jgi:hydroxymethylpyrimidine pyrophosphatase-like HAD family hydrolase